MLQIPSSLTQHMSLGRTPSWFGMAGMACSIVTSQGKTAIVKTNEESYVIFVQNEKCAFTCASQMAGEKAQSLID